MRSKFLSSHSSLFPTLKWFLTGFILSFLLFLLTKIGIRGGQYKIIIFLLVIGLLVFAKKYKNREKAIGKVIPGIIAFFALFLLREASYSYSYIPMWDYLCFYLFGNIGAVSNDFYDPAVAKSVFESLQIMPLVNETFVWEIVDVGFWYPPTSMLLFFPLSGLDLKTSYIIWQTLMILALVASAVIAVVKFTTKTQLKRFSIDNSLIVLLILLFPGLLSPIEMGQSLTLFLLLLLLVIFNINNYKSGVFVALLIIIKPLAALFALYFVFQKKFQALTAFVVTGATIILLTSIIFGFQPFIDYFISPPTSRIPSEIFYEEINQSLNAVILRAKHHFWGSVPEKNIKFLIYAFSFILISITVYSSNKLRKSYPSFSFLVYIPMALIVYPGTLSPSIILLLPVLLAIYNQKLFKNRIMNIMLMFILYAIGPFSLFLFSLIMWILLVTWPRLEKTASRAETSLRTLIIRLKLINRNEQPVVS